MRNAKRAAWVVALLLVVGILFWQGGATFNNPDPLSVPAGSSAGVLDIGILVFREGLECILVLAAITAGLSRAKQGHSAPIATGAGLGLVATLGTWFAAVAVLDALSNHISALQLQAATGLVAIFVLLVVMNWFFHKFYWSGWIAMHNNRKHQLLRQADNNAQAAAPATRGFGSLSPKVFWGLALLGFSSFYREGVEVVLFLQTYRLRLGGHTVLLGVGIGLLLTVAVGGFTFIAQRKLPYKRMLVLTGVMLGAVLLVMVGEQVQEMQLAGWMPSTALPRLVPLMPAWTGLWFSLFPNVESLMAQGFAGAVVIGSYFYASRPKKAQPRAARAATPAVVAPRKHIAA